jgi:FkbM family methyltransferase
MGIKTQIKNIIGPTKIHGIKKTLKYVFNHNEYVAEANSVRSKIELYRTLLHPGDLVFDVGANIGNRVEAFLKMKLKVIAIEPQPDCAQTLREKFGKKISVVEKGVASQPGKMQMHLSNVHMLSTFVPHMNEQVDKERFGNATWNRTIEVPMTTLDELIKQHGTPRFVKIDVEGYEPEVLKGLSKKIDIISFEYMVPEMAKNIYECIGLLNTLNNNYKYNYSIGESMIMALDNFLPFSEFSIALKEEKFLKSSFGDIYVRKTGN